MITRRADGSIDFISLQAQNVAQSSVAGIDIAATYGFELADLGFGDWGSIDLRYLGTINLENDFTPFDGADVIECAGEFGTTCGEPDASYRHRVTANWNKGNVGVQTVWRWVGSVEDDAGPGANFVEDIGVEHYFDTSLSWDVNDNVSLTLGINNMLDNQPPVIGDNDEQANTYPATYDVFGRQYFANLKTRF